MSPTANRSAEAFLQTWEYYAGHNAAGMSRHVGGARACITGVPVPTLNGVYLASETVDPEAAGTLLDQVATFGVPFCLQGRPASVGTLARLAEEHGLTRSADAPLMVLRDAGKLDAAQDVADLLLRELGPTDGRVHVVVAAAGFGSPVELIDRLVPPELLAGSAVRVYAGLVDATPVSTGMAITVDGTVGVFNVATVPEFRGRGYGGAVTARLVADALDSGAGVACLQSSPEGRGVYQRLGFDVVEWWPCWVSTPGP